MANTLRLDRHFFALAPSGGDATMRTYGWTPGIEDSLIRISEVVPWGWNVTREEVPARLTGNRTEVFGATNLDRLQFALFPAADRIAFSVWGAFGPDTAGRGFWRPATHTVFLAQEHTDAFAGDPFALYREDLPLPVEWKDELVRDDAFTTPHRVEPIHIDPTRELRDAAEVARLRHIARLRDQIVASTGEVEFERVLGGLYASLDHAWQSTSQVGLESSSAPFTNALLRLAWLALPLADRRRIWFATSLEDHGHSRPPYHLFSWTSALWGGRRPPCVAFDANSPWAIEPTDGQQFWARLVRAMEPDAVTEDLPGLFRFHSDRAAASNGALVGSPYLSRELHLRRWGGVVRGAKGRPAERAAEVLRDAPRAFASGVAHEDVGYWFGVALCGEPLADLPAVRVRQALGLVRSNELAANAAFLRGTLRGMRAEREHPEEHTRTATLLLARLLQQSPTLALSDELTALSSAIGVESWGGTESDLEDLVLVGIARIQADSFVPPGFLSALTTALPKSARERAVATLVRALFDARDGAARALAEQLREPEVLAALLGMTAKSFSDNPLIAIRPEVETLCDALTRGPVSVSMRRSLAGFASRGGGLRAASLIEFIASRIEPESAAEMLSTPEWGSSGTEICARADAGVIHAIERAGHGREPATVEVALAAMGVAAPRSGSGALTLRPVLLAQLIEVVCRAGAAGRVERALASRVADGLSREALARASDALVLSADEGDAVLASELLRAALHLNDAKAGRALIPYFAQRRPAREFPDDWMATFERVTPASLEQWVAAEISQLTGVAGAPTLPSLLAGRLIADIHAQSEQTPNSRITPRLSDARREAVLLLAFANPDAVLREVEKSAGRHATTCLLQLFTSPRVPLRLHLPLLDRIGRRVDERYGAEGLSWERLGVSGADVRQYSPALARRIQDRLAVSSRSGAPGTSARRMRS